MPRVSWKEGAVISIETRLGIFTLAQMSKEPYLIFFDIFQGNCDWGRVNLNNISILFCKAVTRQFIKNSNISKCKIVTPNQSYEIPKKWLHSDACSRKIVVWEGTDLEKEIVWIGEKYSLVEKDVINHPGGPRRHHSGIFDELLVKEVPSQDNDTIDSYETTSLSVFPQTNERLYLCYKLGKNVSPEKDITLGRNLPSEYQVFTRIIGQLSEEEKSQLRQLYIA